MRLQQFFNNSVHVQVTSTVIRMFDFLPNLRENASQACARDVLLLQLSQSNGALQAQFESTHRYDAGSAASGTQSARKEGEAQAGHARFIAAWHPFQHTQRDTEW